MGYAVFNHFYRPQMKLWEGNVFTPVCHSVHREGCVLQHVMGGGVHTQGRHTHPPGLTPPEMATEAGDMHPTGMHSCSFWQLVHIMCKNGR